MALPSHGDESAIGRIGQSLPYQHHVRRLQSTNQDKIGEGSGRSQVQCVTGDELLDRQDIRNLCHEERLISNPGKDLQQEGKV